MESNKNKFIKKSIIKHSNKYNYSLINYNGSRIKVKIICPKHGIFEQEPANHTRGQGCPICKGVKRSSKKEFIEKSNKVHNNKYDYSLVEYKNNKTKVKIICIKHGIFKQRPDNHINVKAGCPKCANNILYTTKIFIEKATKIHNNKYDYSLVDYKTAHIKIKILCTEHGIFNQKPTNHLRGDGCPICNSSKGENKIREILETYNINYITQKKFDNCRNINPLPFDFYLPEYNMCIEFDGIQHFKHFDFFGGKLELENRKNKDNIKNKYCEDNNIKLLRIKYNEKIEEKLKNVII